LTPFETPTAILAAFAIYAYGHMTRPTEYWAIFYMFHGYIPSIAMTNERLPRRRISGHSDDGGVLVHLQDGRVQVSRADLKYCPQCNTYKPTSREYWHRSPTNAGGLHSICKACRCDNERQRYRQAGD
jgi:hypothetical protein